MIKSLLSLIVNFLNIHIRIRILINILSDPFMDSRKYFQFHGMIFDDQNLICKTINLPSQYFDFYKHILQPLNSKID